MTNLKIGILIPTIEEDKQYLDILKENLSNQINELNLKNNVIIIYDYSPPPITTGEKRNNLLQTAFNLGCDYVWQIDSDDNISKNAIKLVYDACKTGVDVVGINGWMTTDGENRVDWEIRLGHPYINSPRNGKDYYLRWCNHITPMRLEHAIKIKFSHINIGEDYEWSVKLKDSGLLKTTVIVEEFIYHYKCRSKK